MQRGKNRSSGSTWAQDRAKKVRTGQDRTVQSKNKSQCGNISPIWGEAPTVPIRTKISMVGSLPDVIMCANFKLKFLGVTILQGKWNFPFSYWFLHGPYNSAAACDSYRAVLVQRATALRCKLTFSVVIWPPAGYGLLTWHASSICEGHTHTRTHYSCQWWDRETCQRQNDTLC